MLQPCKDFYHRKDPHNLGQLHNTKNNFGILLSQFSIMDNLLDNFSLLVIKNHVCIFPPFYWLALSFLNCLHSSITM